MIRSILRSAAVLALAVSAIGGSVAPASAQYYNYNHHRYHHRIWVAAHWGPHHHWVPAHYIYR